MGFGVPAMTRYAIGAALGAISIILIGCGTNSAQSRYSSLVWRLVTGDRTEISRDQAGAIPYASIAVSIGRADEGLMVLGVAEGERQEWYARSQMIAMTDGRIVQTAGLPFNLTRLEVRGQDGRRTAQGGSPPVGTRYSLIIDYADLRLLGAAADCMAAEAGEEAIDILGTSLMTRHVVENCEIKVIDWSFTNEFWADPETGFIWQSSQYVHPKLSPLLIRVLRPPG
jgi:hypothetical protein